MFVVILALVGLGAVGALFVCYAYTIRAIGDVLRQICDCAAALGGALALMLACAVILGQGGAPGLRLWALDWFALGWGGACALRVGFAYAVGKLSRRGVFARRAVVVGAGAPALRLLRRLEGGEGDIKILGLFDDRRPDRLPPAMARYPLLGAFDQLEDFCRRQGVDLLIVSIPARAEARLLHILQKLWTLPIDIRISALGAELKLRDRAYQYIGDIPFLPVFDKPLSDRGAAVKALFDRAVAAVLIVALAPLLAAVALGVRLSSPGPLLFRQIRRGFNNQQIAILKFRSMYVEASDAEAGRLVTRADPRVTPFGAFIRRWSLDELPQLFNVLHGELSLVGPRPHALGARAGGRLYDQAVEGYFARHRVKPGLTGWAQINGWRGETDTVEKIERRVACDLFYIDHWSVLLDLKILLLTPFAVIFGKNAY